MEDRRGDEPGRRGEDARWLRVQEQIMNLVTAQRTNQQMVAKLEVDVEKLDDHLEELDDHLRGVAGRESMDTRMAVMEREVTGHDAMLRKISQQLDDIKLDLSTLKVQTGITRASESTHIERFKEWLRFWSPIIVAVIALMVPLVTLAVNHWSRVEAYWKQERKSGDPLQEMLERAKRPPPGRRVVRVKVKVVPEKPKEPEDEPNP